MMMVTMAMAMKSPALNNTVKWLSILPTLVLMANGPYVVLLLTELIKQHLGPCSSNDKGPTKLYKLLGGCHCPRGALSTLAKADTP